MSGVREYLGLCSWFVGGDGVGERTQPLVDLDADGGGEVVLLLARGLQQREPHEQLRAVVRPPQVVAVAGVGDVAALARGQVELEVLLLEPPIAVGLQTAGLEERLLESVEGQLLEGDVREGGVDELGGAGRGRRGGNGLGVGVGVGAGARLLARPVHPLVQVQDLEVDVAAVELHQVQGPALMETIMYFCTRRKRRETNYLGRAQRSIKYYSYYSTYSSMILTVFRLI